MPKIETATVDTLINASTIPLDGPSASQCRTAGEGTGAIWPCPFPGPLGIDRRSWRKAFIQANPDAVNEVAVADPGIHRLRQSMSVDDTVFSGLAANFTRACAQLSEALGNQYACKINSQGSWRFIEITTEEAPRNPTSMVAQRLICKWALILLTTSHF